jgi:hypothetical protein
MLQAHEDADAQYNIAAFAMQRLTNITEVW